MIPEYKISIEIHPDSKQIDFIDKQLHDFNVGKIGNYKYTPLFLLLRDSEENVMGGLKALILYSPRRWTMLV
jgi:hypothetical protein